MTKAKPAFRFLLLTIFFFTFTTFMFGQRYKISGTLIDSSQAPLPAATVYIESAKDSTTINYTITEGDGSFSLEGRTNNKTVDFYISYPGFIQYHKRLSLQEAATVDLGKIVLDEQTEILNAVTVVGAAPPVILKEDTLEFNVDSYKTKEGANVEDLFKKLPGFTVDNDGTIKVNGHDITKIQINGENFFGSDVKIATKNLPKDIISKIQVVDAKSEEEEFLGKKNDSDDKMINLVIKEENNKGLFARLTAGAGTNDRYALSGIANYFNQDLRLSVLGSSNNINSIGFSFDEVFDAMGRRAFSVIGGGNNGITKSQSAGANFFNSWGEKTELSANYFYNRASTITEEKVRRENILPDRRYFNNSLSNSKRVNNNHRGDMRFEYKPDTMTRISIRPRITANNGFSRNHSFTESIETDGTKINNSTTERYGEMNGVDFSNSIDFTRKFGDKGAYIQVEFENENGSSNRTRTNYTERNIFNDNGNLVETDIQDQLIKQDETSAEYSAEVEGQIPLFKNWNLELEYEFTSSKNHNKRLFYEAGNNEEYTVLNTDLSSDFVTHSLKHTPNLGLVYDNDTLRLSFAAGLESIRLKNDEKFTDTHFDNTFNNFFAKVYLRYRIKRGQGISFYYRNSSSVPSVSQLQPVVDRTNPLHIFKGNPNLEPTTTNHFSLYFRSFNFQSHYGMYAHLSSDFNANQVVAKTITDQNLVKTTTYTNVDGQYSLRGGVGVHRKFKLKDGSTFKPRIGLRGSVNKYIGFSNGIKYHSNMFSLDPRVSVEYDIPDLITVEPSYSLSYNQAKYSLDSQQNQDYINHNVSLRITTYWPENFFFGNDISYAHLGQTAPGFTNDFVLWNTSLGYKIWDGDGIFKIKVYDVLNQNVSTRRSIGQDYIQDTQRLVLERYMMFSFTYKLSKFGGKKERSHHWRRG